MHARRLIDLWLDDPAAAEPWRCVVAQCRKYVGIGLHSWLECQGQVYDLTRSGRPRQPERYYKAVGMVRCTKYAAPELLREVWRAHWDWWEATAPDDMDLSVLYPLDVRVWSKCGWPDDPHATPERKTNG